MPTERDQRKAQRAENARRWGTWLTQAMTRARTEPKDIVNGSDGTIDKGTVSHWMLGDYGISADNAITVARILRRDPIETLRAAGHEPYADAMAQMKADAAARARSETAAEIFDILTRAELTEADLTGVIEKLDAELASRLARYRSLARAEPDEQGNGENAS